jgi:hypothetical protein
VKFKNLRVALGFERREYFAILLSVWNIFIKNVHGSSDRENGKRKIFTVAQK